MQKLKKGYSLFQKFGAYEALRRIFYYFYEKYARHRLPYRTARYHGVQVPSNRRLDKYLYRYEIAPDRPLYETALCSAIDRHVTSGNNVTIVGAGWGVSTVIAARKAVPGGSVLTYEASTEMVDKLRATISINDVGGSVEVRDQAVGTPEEVWGENAQTVATSIDPTSLTECDVLVLDCEGAETEILNNIEIRPDMLVVESHGIFGASTEAVAEQLQALGYEIIGKHVAEFESGQYGACVADDVYVLTAMNRLVES